MTAEPSRCPPRSRRAWPRLRSRTDGDAGADGAERARGARAPRRPLGTQLGEPRAAGFSVSSPHGRCGQPQKSFAVACSTSHSRSTEASSTHSTTSCSPPPQGPRSTVGIPACGEQRGVRPVRHAHDRRPGVAVHDADEVLVLRDLERGAGEEQPDAPRRRRCARSARGARPRRPPAPGRAGSATRR